MTPMEMLDADIDLGATYYNSGDWRGFIAAFENARQRAHELGLEACHRYCDAELARVEIHIKQAAKNLGVEQDQLGEWEPIE